MMHCFNLAPKQHTKWFNELSEGIVAFSLIPQVHFAGIPQDIYSHTNFMCRKFIFFVFVGVRNRNVSSNRITNHSSASKMSLKT